MKRKIFAVAATFCMLLLIFDPKTALSGAREGIMLCSATVLPSLFPFFVLSGLLTSALSGSDSKFLRPIGRFCGMPEGSESLLLIGFLGGYPTGATAVAQAHQEGTLNQKEARHLLSFCNNPGPAFLFGICGGLFSEAWKVWALWGIQIFSALLTAHFLRPKERHQTECRQRSICSLPQALDRAVQTAARVCGWVVIFRIVIAFLETGILSAIPSGLHHAITGLLELTNGCCLLKTMPSDRLRFLLASLFLSFGGICVLMQTASVTGALGIGSYLKGKVIQSSLCLLLSLSVLSGSLLISAILPILICVIVIKIKKVVEKSDPLVYNQRKRKAGTYYAVS